MKRKLLILICLFLLCACKGSTNEIINEKGNTEKENVSETEESDNNIEQTKSTYETLFGVKTDGKYWYITQPYLNEINLGAVNMLANGDKWWIGIVADLTKAATNIEDSKKAVFDIYFKMIDGYFYVDENGFIETSSNYETHSGLETIKVEGTATDGKYESIGECWVYGYIFMLGDTPAGVIGMNNKDKSEEAKSDIKMYIDAMIDTLVLK